MATSTAQFNPNTGQPLYVGQTVTFQGQTYTGSTPNIQASKSGSGQTQSAQFNPSNGQPLQVGQTVTWNGITYTGTTPAPTGTPSTQTSNTPTTQLAAQTPNQIASNNVVNQQPTSATTATPSSTNSTTAVTYDPTLGKYGITQDVWNTMSPTQQAVVSAAVNAASSLYGANASNVTLSQALTAAAQNPTLVAKYSDALKIDTQAFQQNLAQLQQATTTTAQNNQIQFQNDRKALAAQQAENGTAYSGFRTQAQNNLATQESGIVSSSKSQLQQNLNNATSAFESKYGTNATNPATANFQDPYASSNINISGQYTPPATPATTTLAGQEAGGVTGSQTAAQQADVNNLANQYVTAGSIPAS